MKISDFLTSIETALKAATELADVRDIAVTPGRFNVDELARQSFRAPALRIAFLGAPKTTPTADATRRYAGAFAVFVITDGRGRDLAGIDLTQSVAELIELARFTDGYGVGRPADLRMDALYSGDLNDRGVSLHSISWTHSMRLGQSEAPGTAPDPAAMPPAGTEIDITVLPGAD